MTRTYTKRGALPKCLDCGTQLKEHRAKRCASCATKQQWKDLKEKTPMPECIDCGKTLARRRNKRCIVCAIAARKAGKCGNWKGGKYRTNQGYIYKKAHGHPNTDRNNYVFEHRLVMEKHLGRYLTKKEMVHHINGKKDDNRLENLKLFQNQQEHADHHWIEMRSKKYCCPHCNNEFRLEEVTHGRTVA